MKRHLLPGLMLLVLGYQCLGYPLAFVGSLLGHRMDMAVKVEKAEGESLKTLQIEDSEYQALVWRGKRDFLYGGKMHDLKLAQQQPDGQWTLICEVDDKETEMLANGIGGWEDEEDKDSTPPLNEAPAYTQPAAATPMLLAVEQRHWPALNPQGAWLTMDIQSPPPRRA